MKIEKVREINNTIIKFSRKIYNIEISKKTAEVIALYKQHNVECILAKESENITGCCFLLPKEIDGEKIYWLFNLYSEDKQGSGILILKYIMHNYNNICCIGVTKQAELLYKKMKWETFIEYNRYFKILNLKYFLKQYNQRIRFHNKIIIIIFFYLVKVINSFKIKSNVKNYNSIKTNRIIRIINNTGKFNFWYKIDKDLEKNFAAIEFLSNKKQNFFLSIINGYIKVNAPIFFYSKNKYINKYKIRKHVNSFEDTDKIF